MPGRDWTIQRENLARGREIARMNRKLNPERRTGKFPDTPPRVPVVTAWKTWGPDARAGKHRNNGCTNLALTGCLTTGRFCGCTRSVPNILAVSTAAEFAKRLGVPAEEGRRLLKIFGEVAQDRLFRGNPVGIPYVGALWVGHRGFTGEIPEGRVTYGNRMRPGFKHMSLTKIRFFQPRSWDYTYAQRSLYTGYVKAWAAAEKPAARRVLLTQKTLLKYPNPPRGKPERDNP